MKSIKTFGKFRCDQSDEAFSWVPTIMINENDMLFLGYANEWGKEIALLRLDDEGDSCEAHLALGTQNVVSDKNGNTTILTIYEAAKIFVPDIPLEAIIFCLLDKPLVV